jgi:hypothetical protein
MVWAGAKRRAVVTIGSDSVPGRAKALFQIECSASADDPALAPPRRVR